MFDFMLSFHESNQFIMYQKMKKTETVHENEMRLQQNMRKKYQCEKQKLDYKQKRQAISIGS